ncbi:MAG TPA: hypothetical protein VF182_12330 [Candidatus Binatia bacterium]
MKQHKNSDPERWGTTNEGVRVALEEIENSKFEMDVSLKEKS